MKGEDFQRSTDEKTVLMGFLAMITIESDSPDHIEALAIDTIWNSDSLQNYNKTGHTPKVSLMGLSKVKISGSATIEFNWFPMDENRG
jgi:hypothetical protein